MKDHAVITLSRPPAADRRIPHWVDFIKDKSSVQEQLHPDVDRLLERDGFRFWVTKEYRPAGGDWDDAERAVGLNRTYRLILQEDYPLPPELVERIRLVPDVERVHGLTVGEADLPPHAFARASSFGGATPAELIHLSYAHAFTRGSPDVSVAVLDTGVNLDHPELQGRLVPGTDFVDLDGLDTTGFIGDITGYDDVPEDEVGHGTHVAGIVAARGLRMDEGVAPGCRVMPVRVLAAMESGGHRVGAGIVDNINTGIKWAVDHGADVINMSLGIRHTGGGLPHEAVIRYALARGVTVVAASGNDGTAERYYPGALPGVIAVGAVDGAGAVAPFSSFGANITVVAPGMNVYSAFMARGYAVASGTSQASPHVAGAVALMRSFARERGTHLPTRAVGDVLKHTSDRLTTRLRDEHAGYGLINLADAFRLLTYTLN